MNTKPIKFCWSYRHTFGTIHYGNDTVILVITENAYWNAEHSRYTYYKLTELSENESMYWRELISGLNEKFSISHEIYLDSEESQNLLLSIADQFPESEIRK